MQTFPSKQWVLLYEMHTKEYCGTIEGYRAVAEGTLAICPLIFTFSNCMSVT
jgi:hypothetical protein